MFDRLLTWFGIDMGIDLGTSNTLFSFVERALSSTSLGGCRSQEHQQGARQRKCGGLESQRDDREDARFYLCRSSTSRWCDQRF